jgi:uncharacterized protein
MEKRAVLGEIHPLGQLIFSLGVILFISLVTIMAAFMLAMPFTGMSFTQMMETMQGGQQDVSLMKYIQVASHLGMFIFPSVVLAWFFGRDIANYLFLQRKPGTRVMVVSGLIIFFAVPFINYILELNMQMHLPESLKWLENKMRRAEESAEQLTRLFLQADNISMLLFNLFMVAVIPAIGEELMFRGVLMRIFHRWSGNHHVAVWITAIIFSAIHVQFFGFFPRMILGVVFGYLVVFTGSLWPAMLAHFVNNAAAVISYYLFDQKLIDDTYEHIGKGPEGLLIALVSAVSTVGLLWWVRR